MLNDGLCHRWNGVSTAATASAAVRRPHSRTSSCPGSQRPHLRATPRQSVTTRLPVSAPRPLGHGPAHSCQICFVLDGGKWVDMRPRIGGGGCRGRLRLCWLHGHSWKRAAMQPGIFLNVLWWHTWNVMGVVASGLAVACCGQTFAPRSIFFTPGCKRRPCM